MNPEEYDGEFMPGAENRAIRYFFYIDRGLNILNQFRNLFLGIIAIYLALKLDSWWLLIIMFVPSLIGLALAGWYSTHKMNKVMEFLNVRFSTHYQKKQFDLQQGIYDKLVEINKKLK